LRLHNYFNDSNKIFKSVFKAKSKFHKNHSFVITFLFLSLWNYILIFVTFLLYNLLVILYKKSTLLFILFQRIHSIFSPVAIYAIQTLANRANGTQETQLASIIYVVYNWREKSSLCRTSYTDDTWWKAIDTDLVLQPPSTIMALMHLQTPLSYL